MLFQTAFAGKGRSTHCPNENHQAEILKPLRSKNANMQAISPPRRSRLKSSSPTLPEGGFSFLANMWIEIRIEDLGLR